MEAPICPVCMPFDTDPAGIARTRLFKARLDTRDQRTPGRLVISTHEHIAALREWTEEHWIEFGRFERSLERALKDALDPTEPHKLINLACYMNFAGAEGTHTHWHVLPRYRNPITLTDSETGEAVNFQDDFFGQPYNFSRENYRQISPALMTTIIRAIQERLDLTGINDAQIRGIDG